MKDKRKKVLIIKMSALGDVMIALPHIEAIVAQHPDDRVWLLTSPAFTEFFVHHPRLQVAVLDRRHRLLGNSTLAKILWARRQRFARVYDLQGNRTSRLVTRFSGAPKRVGTQPRSIYSHHPAQEYTRDTRQNVFERLNETLEAGGLAPAPAGGALHLGGEAHAEVAAWKKRAGLEDGRYVLLHAGGSREWGSKRWPSEHFVRLAAMFTDTGVPCVWLGGPDDREVNSRLAAENGIDATGEFSAPLLHELSKGALCAVVNDSGPMHILAVSAIPVFAFFGPTDCRRSHAAGQGERVFYRDIDCSPCFKGVCPRAHECLREIKPEQVFARIAGELLGEGGLP